MIYVLFEKNFPTITINILYIKEKEICPAYISKISLHCEKQIILLMIPSFGIIMDYLAVKKMSTLLRGITFCSFRTKNKLKYHEKACKNKDFCAILMPSEKGNILELNKYIKSDKMPYIIYAEIESLIRKVGRCANNPEKSSTTKIVEHIPCEYSMSAIWGFDHIENKRTLYCGKDCIKKLCTS